MELVLADEVARRETSRAMVRARAAGLEPAIVPDAEVRKLLRRGVLSAPAEARAQPY